MPKDRFQFSRLLSGRHRLTVQEKEAVLERVLFASCAEEPAPKSIFGLSGLGLRVAAAAALSALLLIPAVVFLLPKPSDETINTGTFSVRGDGGQVPSFSVNCIGSSEPGVCRQGDKLAFRLSPPEGKPYFGAFAHRATNDAVIWYFPENSLSLTIKVTDKNQSGILSKGIQLGMEHPAGRYQVFGVFSDAPLTREKIKALFGDHFEIKSTSAVVSSVSFILEP